MAKHLGLVPIPGSQVVAHGLRFTAEETAGRRNKIGTVRIARVGPDPEAAADVPAKPGVDSGQVQVRVEGVRP